MGALYLTWLADELRAAGLELIEVDGWQRRARSSGGFNAPPLAVAWHHTASNGNARNDVDYMVYSSPSRPTANLYVARDGAVWVMAAGATNTSGKGRSMPMSRGSVPKDSANTTTVGIEAGNNGVGMEWPEAQIDAFFTTSNVVNARLGNRPDDVFTHQFYAPDRKVDPATAAAVKGRWRPRTVTSSGTWSNDDVRAECAARATASPPEPEPTPVATHRPTLALLYRRHP